MNPAPTPEFIALQQAVTGRYSLDSELGRGGMGVVFLARDVALDRPVAIKLLPADQAAGSERRAGFLREARTAAGLSHPHIVPIHTVEEHGDLVFYVMTWIDGETLGDRVRRAGPLPPSEAMRLCQEVAWALAYAHARGIVHRDIKPDNILIERDTGRAMVTDFGIAALANEAVPDATAGTPRYMSPEQAAGKPVDGRSDLYALGVTFYYATTGRFPAKEPTGTGVAVVPAGPASVPVPLGSVDPRLPPGFALAIDRCLHPDRDRRFATADELAEAVGTARATRPPIPAPVRAFLRETESTGIEVGTSLLVAAGSLAMYGGLFRDDLMAGLVFVPIAMVMVGLAGGRVGEVVFRARDLQRQGYRFRSLGPALARLDQEQEEEAMGLGAVPGSNRDLMLSVAVGAVKTAGAVILALADLPTLLNIVGAAGAVVMPALTLRDVWIHTRRGRRGLWRRVIQGPFGRLLFFAGGVMARMTGQPPPSAPAIRGEPTAAVLARAVGDVYAGLPVDVRRRLPGVPDLIARLERDVGLLRQRDRTPRTEGRLRAAVEGLESLRLELWRLGAGRASTDDLTADLEALRRIGDDIDAELSGRREVARLLNPDTPPA